MSILCGTDFSAETRDATRVAAMLAERRNEPLQLVHAVDPPMSVAWDEDLQARARAADISRLHAEAERARALSRLAIEESITDGPADEILVSTAASRESSLIVLGALGRRGGPSWRIGGTAQRVAATANAPVLVVRNAGPLEVWLREQRPLKVVVGDDLTPVSEAALRWAAELRQVGPCELVVCHVFSLFEEKSRLGIGGSLFSRVSELEQASLTALRRHAAPILGDVDAVRYRVEGTLGRAAEPLLDIASDEAAHLLVVGAGHRNVLGRAWHGWASQIVLNDAACSVACVPMTESHRREPDAVPILQRVLVTTDFSPIGNRAIGYAHAIVADGGTVHILNVDESGAPSMEKLRQLVPSITPGKRVETRLEIVRDPGVSAAITAAAERLDVDVICMGTHGRSGLSGAMLGSVARAVAARCRRQVLLVPPQR